MAAASIPVLNVGEAFERYLGPHDPGALFESTQHYNDAGYRVMAKWIAPALLEMGVAPMGAPLGPAPADPGGPATRPWR